MALEGPEEARSSKARHFPETWPSDVRVRNPFSETCCGLLPLAIHSLVPANYIKSIMTAPPIKDPKSKVHMPSVIALSNSDHNAGISRPYAICFCTEISYSLTKEQFFSN